MATKEDSYEVREDHVQKYSDVTANNHRGELALEEESSYWWTVPIKIPLLVVSAVLLAFLLALAPLLCFAGVAQRIYARRHYSRYRHKKPSDARIAVIGGGWTGVQAVARLRELGVTNARGFERYDDWGGTWHPSLRYHGLETHGPMWITTFKGFPYSGVPDINEGKVRGEEAQRYVQRYGRDQKIRESFRFSSEVVKIKHDTNDKTAMLVVKDSNTGETREEGPFDLVVFASQAAEPNLPDLPGRQSFKGEVYHSTQFKTEVYDRLLQENKKVVVVGGSKAACDQVRSLQRGGHHNFRWVFEKPYLFWKYEPVSHSRTLVDRLLAVALLLGMLVAPFSTQLSGWFFWASGLACPLSPRDWHNDWTKFHFGLLCPDQRRDLARVDPAKVVRGARPTGYAASGRGLELSNGTVLDGVDVVLFATGCRTGIENLALEKDGVPYDLDTANTKMLDHFVFPGFPVLANATALWLTFGPLRGVNVAEMAVYHACMRDPSSGDEDQLKASADRQVGGSMDASASWLFQSRTGSSITYLLTIHLDLILRGYLNVADCLQHFVEMFVLGKQSPLKLNMLPGMNGDEDKAVEEEKKKKQ